MDHSTDAVRTSTSINDDKAVGISISLPSEANLTLGSEQRSTRNNLVPRKEYFNRC